MLRREIFEKMKPKGAITFVLRPPFAEKEHHILDSVNLLLIFFSDFRF